MKRIITVCLAAFCLSNMAMAQTKTVDLRIIETTDVHGSFPITSSSASPKVVRLHV